MSKLNSSNPDAIPIIMSLANTSLITANVSECGSSIFSQITALYQNAWFLSVLCATVVLAVVSISLNGVFVYVVGSSSLLPSGLRAHLLNVSVAMCGTALAMIIRCARYLRYFVAGLPLNVCHVLSSRFECNAMEMVFAICVDNSLLSMASLSLERVLSTRQVQAGHTNGYTAAWATRLIMATWILSFVLVNSIALNNLLLHLYEQQDSTERDIVVCTMLNSSQQPMRSFRSLYLLIAEIAPFCGLLLVLRNSKKHLADFNKRDRCTDLSLEQRAHARHNVDVTQALLWSITSHTTLHALITAAVIGMNVLHVSTSEASKSVLPSALLMVVLLQHVLHPVLCLHQSNALYNTFNQSVMRNKHATQTQWIHKHNVPVSLPKLSPTVHYTSTSTVQSVQLQVSTEDNSQCNDGHQVSEQYMHELQSTWTLAYHKHRPQPRTTPKPKH